MKTTKILLAFILAFSLLMGGALATGSCVLSTPSTNENRCMNDATNLLTATCSGLGVDENVTSLEFFYRNGTSDTVWHSIGLNGSFNETVFTMNFNTGLFAESSAGYLNITYDINGTNQSLGGANYSALYSLTIEIDNNAPTVDLRLEFEDFVSYGESEQIAYCDKSTDTVDTSLTYSHILRDPLGDNTTATTSGRRTYNMDEMMLPDTADGYTAFCQVTDNCGNSSTTSSSFSNIDGDDAVAKKKFDEAKEEEAKKKEKDESESDLLLWIIIFGGVAVVIIVASLLSKKSKKK